MKIIKVLTLSTAIAASIGASAQRVSYKVATDAPDAYKRTMLYLDLFTVDTYLEPALGSAAKLETVIGDRIMPWAQVKFAWTDAASTHAVTGYPMVDGGQKKQLSTDVGAALFLINKEANRKIKVVLSSHSFGGYRHTKYLMVPGTVKKMFGVEGGLNFMRKALRFEDQSHQFFRYQSMDGSQNLPIEGVGSSGTPQPAGLAYAPQSMTNVMSIAAGIHYRRVTNLTIQTDEYGTRSNRSTGDLYANVLVAPVVSIANVIDPAGVEWKLVAQDGGKKNLGWRLGYTHHNSVKVGFSYNFEVGQRPGPVMGDDFLNNGTYISLGMGLSIGSNKYLKLGNNKDKK